MQLRNSGRAILMLATALTLSSLSSAQTTAGASNAGAASPQQSTPAAPSAQVGPLAPAQPPAPITFPKPNPLNFTSDSLTIDTVNSFLRNSWGFDPNRVWQVEAILKTPVAGLTKVIVAVGEKGSAQGPGNLQFFVLPDGKHLIAEDVLPFGARPFDDTRKVLTERATGPSRGAASKDLLLVEFSDYQCPHCKDAQATVDKLLQDFPNAHFVYENLPLVQIHPDAYKAAAYSVCVDKAAGDAAFFKFSSEVFANQAFLTPEAADKTLKDAATKAGANADAIAACSTTPAAKAAIDVSMKLASDLGVNSTPTLYVNGRGLPLNGAYDQLKTVIAYQLTLDGIRPSLASNPAP